MRNAAHADVKFAVIKSSPKTFDDVRKAFETGRILQSSSSELEEMLVAISSEAPVEGAQRARAREMGDTIRQLLESKRIDALRPRMSKLAVVALILSVAALICSGVQGYYAGRAYSAAIDSAADMAEFMKAMNSPASVQAAADVADARTEITLGELATRAPSIRTGTLQAWWAGEQARQVQRYEAQARRQLLAGDRDGAARSASRADAIRSGIPSLAGMEKPRPQN
jgi:hypothetical protein